MSAPRPFRIDIPDADLADLRARLDHTRWPTTIADSHWDYGADLSYIRELCDYWRDEYDWRAVEARLNEWPQFRHLVDGVDIHFLHVRGSGPDPQPLLMLHGWPGSIWEFNAVIDQLANPAAHGFPDEESFDVVVAALPGFGFSGQPTEPGWGVSRIAAAMNRLMIDLGYSTYAAQGGDWGGIICAQLGADHPTHCTTIHVNQTVTRLPARLPEELHALENWASSYRSFMRAEGAYSQVQRTKPDSLALAQSDSPAGLAAWVVEKFHGWSDTGGDIENSFSKDDLITNLMFYWLPNSVASAARIYYEQAHDDSARAFAPVQVPTAVAAFPAEPFSMPRPITELRYRVVRWSDLSRGGHFAALENPDELAADVRAYFRERRATIT